MAWSRLRQPTAGTILGVLVAVGGALICLGPLDDNSFFTHLATGRYILAEGSVPSHDVYSYTAGGAPWVVQSWLVSLAYAVAESLGGLTLVRAVVGLSAGAVAALAWALLRPVEALVVRLALAVLFLVVAAGSWAERPLMVGLVGFALVVLAGEGRLEARWLLPVGWIWLNSHGSFPLGVVYLLCLLVGSTADDRHSADGAVLRRALAWLVGGLLLGVVGPLGLRALTFPLDLLSRQDLLQEVVEWQSPSFVSTSQRAFLVMVALAVLGLVRRPSYRAAVPTAVFVVAALLGARNLPVAAIALLPVLAGSAPRLGALRSSLVLRAGRPALVLTLAMGALALAGRLGQPDVSLHAYPLRSLAYLAQHDVDLEEDHLASREVVGNLLTYVYGPGRRVFYDDRFDMYPAEISEVALALNDAGPGLLLELDQLDIDLLVLPRDAAASLAIRTSPAWRSLVAEQEWQMWCRRGRDLGSGSLRC